MPFKDSKKRKAYSREYYRTHKKQTKDYYLKNKNSFYLRNRKAKSRNKKIINELKEKGCCRCGWNEHPCGLDYHHKDSSLKKLSIARLVNFSYGKETLIKEVEKCILLCSNCHRVFHKVGFDISSF
jgi:hypothetical protein